MNWLDLAVTIIAEIKVALGPDSEWTIFVDEVAAVLEQEASRLTGDTITPASTPDAAPSPAAVAQSNATIFRRIGGVNA